MNRVRFVFLGTMLCIPTVILVGIGVYFAVTRVPKLVKYEPVRVGLAYRALAEGIAEHPEAATRFGARQPGWGAMKGRIGGRPWGRTKSGENVLVWCQTADGDFAAKEVAAIEEFDFALVFYGGGGLVALGVVGLTAFGVAMFGRVVRERDDFLAATARVLTTPLVGVR